MSRSLRNPLLAVEIAPSNRRCSLSAVGAAAGVESASWRRSSSDVGAETGVDVGAETGVGEGALEQRPLRDGRQSVHDLPALTQEQDTQRPLPLHRQHTGIELPHTHKPTHGIKLVSVSQNTPTRNYSMRVVEGEGLVSG